jgi:hypothetical protein
MSKHKKSKEPECLQRGKKVHRKIQKEWLDTAEGDVGTEKSITKPDGRKGRVDVFVRLSDDFVGIAEIKSSDWDAMTLQAVRRNAKRQIRQIWKYIESQLEDRKDVSAGVIFPKRPKDSNRLNLIEQLFEENAIQVVWQDESVDDLKRRKSQM